MLATGYETPAAAAAAAVALGSGHGLSGMAERAAAFGGTLEAGSLSGGGWRGLGHVAALPHPPLL